MNQILQSKYKHWQNGFKNYPTYVIYKILILDPKTQIESEGWEIAFYATSNQQRAGSYINRKSRLNIVTEDKGHCILRKGSIHQEDVIHIHIYITTAPKHMQEILTELVGEIDGSTITLGDFNSPRSVTIRTTR